MEPEHSALLTVLPPQDIMVVVVSAVVVYLVARKYLSTRRPPGPSDPFFIGNIFRIPSKESWRWFERLAQKYGPIAYLRLMGEHLVVLSDPNIAEELLGTRSSNYSSRKYYPYAGKYRSGNKRMLLLPYNEEFKKQRAAMRLLFIGDQPRFNRKRQFQQSKKLLFELLQSDINYMMALKRYSSGIILGVCYGMNLDESSREFHNVLENNESMGSDLKPGARIADVIPWLDILPDWLSPWRLDACQKHETELKLFNRWAEIARHGGENREKSFMYTLFGQQEKLDVDDKSIAYIGGTAIEAGTNTTSCLLHCFLLACVSNPDVVARAQEELDRVLLGNPPTWDDYYQLPYIFAVVKETLRWCPVTPLAFPHMTESCDNYHGHDIPAGSLVIASIWNMHRNPEYFPNPSMYHPERFYSPNSLGMLRKDSSLTDGIWAFGFGKR
ncbi:hypothetical protein VKT23_009570 [Stygiomarasmius scandens]